MSRRASHSTCMLVTARSVAGVVGVIAVAGSAGCGGARLQPPDPFSDGFNGARVVVSRVICQPIPDNCERVVVLAPTAIGQAELIQRVEARLASALNWRSTRYREVVESDEGEVFDGRTSRQGGSVDTVQAELRYWARSGWAQEVPADSDEQAVLTAARATPDGVVVTIV